MRTTAISLLIALLGSVSVVAVTSGEGSPTTAAQAMQVLNDGNQRFVAGNMTYPHHYAERLDAVKSAQHPFATVLSCSDSRVPVELVFDAGFGDLFGVREAGKETQFKRTYQVERLNQLIAMEKSNGWATVVDEGSQDAFVQSVIDGARRTVDSWLSRRAWPHISKSR